MESDLKSVNASAAPEQHEYLTPLELSRILNVSRKAVVHWTQTHQLPVIKMGRLNRYPFSEIKRRLSTGSLLELKQ